MLRWIFIFLMGLMSFSPLMAQEELINDLNEQAYQAQLDYDFRKALDLTFTALNVHQNMRVKNDTTGVILCMNIAVLYDYYQKFDSSRKYFEKTRVLCESKLGKKNEVYVNLCLMYGGFLEEMNELEEARIILHSGLENIKHIDPPNDVYPAYLNNNMAIVLEKLGLYREALKHVDEALHYTELVFTRNSVDYWGTSRTKSTILRNLGRYQDGIELLEESGKNLKALDDQGSSYAKYLNSRGVILSELGKLDNAFEAYKQAAELEEKLYGENSLSLATVLSNLGAVEYKRGHYESGRDYYLRAYQMLLKLLGENNLKIYMLKIDLAGILFDNGRWELARQEYEEYVPKIKTIAGNRHPSYVTARNNQINFYIETQAYRDAQLGFNELNGLIPSMENKDLALSLESNYAVFLKEIGKVKDGSELMVSIEQKAKQLYGEGSPNYGHHLLNMAVNQMGNGEFVAAEANMRKAKKIFVDASGEKSENSFRASKNLAILLYDSDQNKEALKEFKRLCEIRKEEHGEDLELTDMYYYLGMSYIRDDQVNEGADVFEESLRIQKEIRGEDHPKLSSEYRFLATINTYRGDFNIGYDYFQKAQKLDIKAFNELYRFMTEEEKLNFLETRVSEMKQLQAIALDKVKDYPKFGVMAFNIELLMKGMVLNSTGSLRNAAKNHADPKVRNMYAEWMQTRKQLAVEMNKPKAYRGSNYDELEKSCQKQEQLLTLALGKKSLRLQEVDWKDVQAQMKGNELLIEFVRLDDFESNKTLIAAITLKNQGLPKIQVVNEEKVLADYLKSRKGANSYMTVKHMYASRGAGEVNSDPQQQQQQPGLDPQELNRMIFRSLENELKDVEVIHYSPTGVLNKVAFAALTTEDGKYLSEAFQLNAISSGRQLINRVDQTGWKDVLLVGGVNYDKAKNLGKEDPGASHYVLRESNGASWNYLSGTLTEAKSIQEQFKSAGWNQRLMTDDDAGEYDLQEALAQQPDILHIATHGFFIPKPNVYSRSVFLSSGNPMLRTGLVLSGGNKVWTGKAEGGSNDGILTAYEVANMDMSGVKLAVLSACETGLGEIKGSEGVFGLQRAFKQAGVEYIVMSLWQVPDKETAEFMNEFYSHIRKNVPVEKAFNLAQAAMREKHELFSWAAFVLMR